MVEIRIEQNSSNFIVRVFNDFFGCYPSVTLAAKDLTEYLKTQDSKEFKCKNELLNTLIKHSLESRKQK